MAPARVRVAATRDIPMLSALHRRSGCVLRKMRLTGPLELVLDD